LATDLVTGCSLGWPVFRAELLAASHGPGVR
jgi:hypothetical protein